MSDSEPITTTNLTVSGNLALASGTTVSGLAFDKVSGLTRALAGKANLVSPVLIGVPTAPTATLGENTTQLATTAFVHNAVTNIVGAAPPLLNTLTELAGALGGDADFTTTVTNQLALKAPLDSPTFTGTVRGITKAMVGLSNVDNTTDAEKPVSLLTQAALDGKVNNTISAQFAGNAATVTNGVKTIDDQTIGGTKTFSSIIVGDVSGNAATVTNGVYTTGDQTIGGTKTFSSIIVGSISGNAATVTNGVKTIDDQTIGGTKTFSNTIVGSISGNAATVTNGVKTIDDQIIGGIKTFSNTIGGSISGNAATATKFANARTIAGQAFDGTENITIASTDLTDGSSLATKTYVDDALAVVTAMNAAPTIAIGQGAGAIGQGTQAVAIGANAGNTGQDHSSVAIGANAGKTGQSYSAVAIGADAGFINQTAYSVAIGAEAGNNLQRLGAVAVGNLAGQVQQGTYGVAIGYQAGNGGQGTQAVAIGYQAGQNIQGANAIAIGDQAGQNTQGTNAIAIGYKAAPDGQHANSIVINASGFDLNSVADGAFHVAPIRSGSGYSLLYDNTTREITVSSSKTFVIDHPTNENKYLVHVCLEGPESGVYYRGEGEIVNNLHTTIHLPAYVERLATEFTIQVTQIYSGKKMEPLYTSRVENNSFVVYGENCEFYWHVTGKRGDVEVEPSKDKSSLKGSGPYKWLE